MPVPVVSFSPDSANAYECVAWAARSIVNGQVRAEALEDIPATGRVLYRVLDDLTERIKGPQVWGDTPADLELQVLASSLDIPLEVASSVSDGPASAGISSTTLILMVRAILKILEMLNVE